MSERCRDCLEALGKSNSCYVLITCGDLTEDGQMQVEMTYQGDPTLASYLLQGAQMYMEQEEEESDFNSTNKSIPFKIAE